MSDTQMVPGRIVLVGNADRMKELPAYSDVEVYRRCERCGKDDAVIINKWQAAKADEINARYEWSAVTAGGKTRAPCALFCWECARTLGMKSKGIPIPKEKLNNV